MLWAIPALRSKQPSGDEYPAPTPVEIFPTIPDTDCVSLMEGMAGGVKRIGSSTRVTSGRVEIRLSSRERMDPAAFGRRRLDLYNRTLAWLGGSLECNQASARIRHETTGAQVNLIGRP